MSDNLTAAREALTRLSALLPVLRMYASVLRVQHPQGEIKAAVCAYNPDGTGNVGPAWAFDPFLADLIAVAGDDESEDETPAMIAALDELEADLAALRIEHEAHAALLTVTRGERDRLRPRHREAYEAGRKAGIEEAAKECDDRATTREAAAEEMHKAGSYSDATIYRTYAAAERALAGTLRGLATKPP